mgnify:CR=1 FL=1
MGKTGRLNWLEYKMMLWNTGLAQGNTETNELGYTSGLKRMFLFSECKTLPDFASITIAAYGAANPQKGNDTNRNIAISFLMPDILSALFDPTVAIKAIQINY